MALIISFQYWLECDDKGFKPSRRTSSDSFSPKTICCFSFVYVYWHYLQLGWVRLGFTTRATRVTTKGSSNCFRYIFLISFIVVLFSVSMVVSICSKL